MWIRRTVAAVLIVVGAVWVLQGVGILGGSFMTGEAVWAVIGVACVAAGLFVLRPPRRS